MDDLMQLVQPFVTEQMNEEMDAAYTEKEVEKALFRWLPRKRPTWMDSQQGFFSGTGTCLKMM
jgi:hypothetical protein